MTKDHCDLCDKVIEDEKLITVLEMPGGRIFFPQNQYQRYTGTSWGKADLCKGCQLAVMREVIRVNVAEALA